MLRLYVPVAVTVVLIASLTFWESIYSDRFRSSSVTAEEFGKRFADVPKEVGDWVGTDQEVAGETLEVAGAVNHVSRKYVNTATNQEVDLWLIVGHSRDIGRHTPDICYPSQGFAQDGAKQKQKIEVAGEEGVQREATFFTARFRHETALGGGGPLQRVFWAWNPNTAEESQWIAPDSQRTYFGNNPALYKMYFTATMPDRDQPIAESAAMDFAKIMIPEVNRALFPERYGQASAESSVEAEGAANVESAGESSPAEAAAPATAGA
jgi:hypothetical protein